MSDFTPHRIYGVVGYPLGHSLSPLLHTTAFQALGIPAALVPWALEPAQLPDFIRAVRLLNIQGACVTIPHKQAVIPLLDEVTDRVRAIGAANLLYWRDGRLWGDNTDILGFIEPLKQNPPAAGTRALILGAGGAARAVAAGLQALDLTDITVTDIVEDLPESLARDFHLQRVPWDRRGEIPADLIVNVTPLGMKGRFETETPYPAEWFAGRTGVAYDIVYSPFETRFLWEAQNAGWRTIGGLGMFLAQADAQFLAWTGRHLPEEAKRKTAEALGG